MTKSKKLLKKLVVQPGSLRYAEIEAILFGLGFEKRYGKGSHAKFRHKQKNIRFSIPVHNRECKIFYKKEIARTLQKYFSHLIPS